MREMKKHPSEAELQYYAEWGSATEKIPVHKHVEQCEACRYMVEVYHGLQRQLDALPLLPAPEGFADRIVSAAVSKPAPVPDLKRYFIRPEIQNALIATAATYLFIVSGVLSRLVTLDGLSLENTIDRRVNDFLGLLDLIRSMLA